MKQRIAKIKESFPSIADVVKASNLTEEELALANYSGTSSRMIGARAAVRRELVADLFNTREDGSKWEVDWKNTDERKWFPVFDMDADTTSGVGFSFSRYGGWVTFTDVGSRFAFESEELSDLSAELYPELYIESLTK